MRGMVSRSGRNTDVPSSRRELQDGVDWETLGGPSH